MSVMMANRLAALQPGLGEVLRAEIEWLGAMIDARFNHYFKQGRPGPAPSEIVPPPLRPGSSSYADFLAELGTGRDERVLVALALAPHVAPQALDMFFLKNQAIDRGFSEFGGVRGVQHGGFLPTGETALFVLAGDDVGRRLQLTGQFDPERPLFARRVLRLEPAATGEPAWSGALSFSPAWLRHLLTGEEHRPETGAAFPATRIATDLTWADLVLDPETLAEVGEIKAWARHGRELREEWGLGRHLKPGFRALFHGPPGTGKTLTASLLGQELGVPVYRVDLSQVISKYIGETEKNLATVFAEAARHRWLLFFDEADALFGQRTATSSAHDRYANQEVSFLLQRIEEHPGIVVLATNLKSNLDEAFARRFQAVVHFAPPDAGQRLQLWRNTFGARVRLAAEVDLAKIARDHEVTGGQILNIVRRVCLLAVQRREKSVLLADLIAAVQHELRKGGAT